MSNWYKEYRNIVKKMYESVNHSYPVSGGVKYVVNDSNVSEQRLKRREDLTSTETSGYRVIGGDRGDLHYEGFSFDIDGDEVTISLYKPVLISSLTLNTTEVKEISNDILASFVKSTSIYDI